MNNIMRNLKNTILFYIFLTLAIALLSPSQQYYPLDGGYPIALLILGKIIYIYLYLRYYFEIGISDKFKSQNAKSFLFFSLFCCLGYIGSFIFPRPNGLYENGDNAKHLMIIFGVMSILVEVKYRVKSGTLLKVSELTKNLKTIAS